MFIIPWIQIFHKSKKAYEAKAFRRPQPTIQNRNYVTLFFTERPSGLQILISRSIDKTKELQASSLHWTCASYPVISDIFHTIRNLNRISLLKAEKVIKLRYVYWLWRVSIASKVIFYKKRPMGHIVHLNNNVIIWFESGQRSYDINYNTIQDYMHE